jgi:hypothetical protein
LKTYQKFALPASSAAAISALSSGREQRSDHAKITEGKEAMNNHEHKPGSDRYPKRTRAMMARESTEPSNTRKSASKPVFSERARRSLMRTRARPTTKIRMQRAVTCGTVIPLGCPSGPSSIRKKSLSAVICKSVRGQCLDWPLEITASLGFSNRIFSYLFNG